MSKLRYGRVYRWLALGLVGLLVAALLAACGDSTPTTAVTTSVATTAASVTTAASATTAAIATTAATTAAATTSAATTAASAATTIASTTSSAATTAANVATTAASVATTGAAATGARLTVGVSSIPASLDPVSGLSFATPAAFAYLAYNDTITSITDGKASPALALSWKQVDASNWEFKLRPNVTFSNGEAFDSAALVYTFDTYIKKQPRPPLRLATVDSWAAPDATTFTIKTKTPDPVLAGKLAQIFVLPPKYHAESGQAFATKPVGTGPYEMTLYERDKQIIFKARTNSWHGTPKNSELILRAVRDGATRTAALRSGELDLVQLDSKDQYDDVTGKGFKGVTSIIGSTTYVSLVTNKGGPLADKKVRQALNLAVDRKTITEALFGEVTKPANQILGPIAFGYDSGIAGASFDVERAKKLLQEAGVKEGDLTLPITYNTAGAGRKETVEVLQQFLGNVGVKVEAQPLDVATFLDKSNKGELGPASLTVVFYLPAADGDLAMESLVSAGGTTVRYKNEELDKLFTQQRSETDPAKREKILQQMTRILDDDPPGILLYYGFTLWAHSTKVSGFQAPSSGLAFFNSVTRQP